MRGPARLLLSLRRWVGALLAADRSTSAMVLVFALTQLPTLFWDLPGSHGWENDGLAPRDLFAGLVHNLTPGQGHQYPLLHCFLLAVLCLPILLPTVLAGSLTSAAIRERVLSVPAMTGISLVAKLVAIAMACLTLLVLARIVRRTVSARAGRLAVLFGATNIAFAFYGRVSNLEVPYLTWTVLALDALLDVLEDATPLTYRRFLLLAAAAVATKDQAYASFVLVAPLYLVVLPLLGPGGLPRARVRDLFRAAGFGALGYGLMSGAIVNPTGFLARVRLLTGPASEGWRGYSRDSVGLFANVRDALAAEPKFFWPLPALWPVWFGVLVAALMRPGVGPLERRAGRLLLLVAGLSSFLFFTLPVARSEPRFLLPLGLFLAAYGGVALDFLLPERAEHHLTAWVVRIALGAALSLAAWKSFAVHLTQLGDARRDVSAWLAELPRGTSVETYGLTVYAPHFDVRTDAPYRVTRVGPERARARNPLVGVTELEAEIGEVEARKPDVLVLSEGFANTYFAGASAPGRTLSSVVQGRRTNLGTTALVWNAVLDTLPHYHQALVARPKLPDWARRGGLVPLHIQSTTGLRVWVLVRDDSRADRPR